MVTILDTIAEKTKERIQEEKKSLSLARLKEMIKEKQVLEQEQAGNEHVAEKFRFAEYLGRPGMSFICEVKKASPSKGVSPIYGSQRSMKRRGQVPFPY